MKTYSISWIRMFLYLLESSLSAVFLLGYPMGFAAAVLIWPFALVVLFVQLISVLVLLPVLFFVGLPLSMWLYKKGIDDLIPWVGYFFIMSFLYALCLAAYMGKPTEGASLLVLVGLLTGVSMWTKMFNLKWDTQIKKENSNSP